MKNGYEEENRAESRAEENQENQKTRNVYTISWENDVPAEDAAALKSQRGRRKFRLKGSLAAKIIAFFLLAASCLVGLAAGFLCMYMESWGFYTEDLDSVMLGVMKQECRYIAYIAESYIEQGDQRAISELCDESNFELQLIYTDDNEDEVLWSHRSGYKTNLKVDIGFIFDQKGEPVRFGGNLLEDGNTYLLRIYIDPEFSQKDDLSNMAEVVKNLYGRRYILIALAAGGILLCLICFLFLMCSAGYRNGREGIVPGALTRLHLDVLTAVFGGGAAVVVIVVLELLRVYSGDMAQAVVMSLGGTALVVWLTFYFRDVALRMKCGLGWRYSLIYVILRGMGRVLGFLGRELAALVRGLPLVITTVTAYLGICILEFLGVILFMRDEEGVMLWALEKVVLLFLVAYIALMCRKLLKASRKLADGEENYQVDTARMFGAFREHGENLNSLGLGISKAVEARMKSERMKTELISNVSHDLKTPLTSIINYADLIWEEVNPAGDAETGGQLLPAEISVAPSIDYKKIREYAEVLLRQSRRLKKLLDDLVEASKATTGNLEVNLEPCEVGVLLTQAVGEYQQRMEEKHLELIARQPQEGVTVLADGRRLWRVFENLLNNICKYACENSRVYLNVDAKENEVQIIFRNMSKYPLDISAEELEERFVRGDKSRHMEGNGLGLSIAKSLVELQNGRMEIVIDGDLFKVMLRFPLYSREQKSISLTGHFGGSLERLRTVNSRK